MADTKMQTGPPSAVGTTELAAARRELAQAAARVAELAVAYADDRTAADRQRDGFAPRPGGDRARPGEFVSDEVSLVLREQP